MKSVPFDEYLIDWLKEPEKARVFFDVTIEEYKEDHNFGKLVEYLHILATAQGGLLHIANAEMNQENLDSLLEKVSNPSWEQIVQELGCSFLPVSAVPVPSY